MSWVLLDYVSQQRLALVQVDIFELILGLRIGLRDQLVFVVSVPDHKGQCQYGKSTWINGHN